VSDANVADIVTSGEVLLTELEAMIQRLTVYTEHLDRLRLERLDGDPPGEALT
jgi:hypothetical protein